MSTSHPEFETLAQLADPSIAAGTAENSDPDDATTAAGFAQAASHVRSCAQCTADIAALVEVRARLSQLPRPPLPAEVAHRLDTALAAALADGERVTGSGASEKLAAPPLTAESLTVVPLVSEQRHTRRHGRQRSAEYHHRIPASVAAGFTGLLVIGLGTAIALGTGGHTGAKRSTNAGPAFNMPVSSASASGPHNALSVGHVPVLLASGTRYTEATFRQQIGAVLVSQLPSLPDGLRFGTNGGATATGAGAASGTSDSTAGVPPSAPSASPENSTPPSESASPGESQAAALAPEAESPQAPAPSGLTGSVPEPTHGIASGPLTSASELQACVDYLAGTSGIQPTLVDYATFNGAPATIITFTDPTVAGTLDVYVIADSISCRSGNVTYFTSLNSANPAG